MTTSKRQPPWSADENKAVIALYFHMLSQAIAGKPYNKAAMIRTAQSSGQNVGIPNGYHGQLADRSKQSVEFKLMNATAAHQAIDPSAVTMHGFGYRAMPNMQAELKTAMGLELKRRAIFTAEPWLGTA